MKFKAHQRREVYQKYKGRCAYCGQLIKLTSFQVDHFIPDHQNNEISNLMPSCRLCNYFKSNRDIESFRKYILNTLYVTQHKNPKNAFLYSYNLIHFHDISITFHFEKADKPRNSCGMELKEEIV